MAMEAGSTASNFSPHVVGGAFVKQYYETLRDAQGSAHLFYQDSSILGRADSNGNLTIVTTMKGINDYYLSVDFTGSLIELEYVDSLSSHVGGVLISVTGSFTTDGVKQKFTQSFFLAPQESGGYFVLNDIFRFVSARPSSERSEVIVNCDSESTSATLQAEPETASVRESRAPELPAAVNIPVNDEVISSSANGIPPVKNNTDVETCVKAVNKDVEKRPKAAPTSASAKKDAQDVKKITEAAPTPPASSKKDAQGVEKVPEAASTPASAEKDVPKKTYASIVKVMLEHPPPAPTSKPKPTTRPKAAAQNAEKSAPSPPKPAHATNAAHTGDKSISANQSNDEPGYSVFVKNLPFNATVEMVEQEFRKFGAIKPGGIQVRNRQPDRFCFGFVEFESQSSMHAAIEAYSVYFGTRESYIEEKRTATRVVNGVITRGSDNGYASGSRVQSGRGGYYGENFRGRGEGFVNNGSYHDGEMRNGFRNQNGYSGRGRGPQGNGYPQNGNTYNQNRNGYHQNGNGYHQNSKSYPQNENGSQQRRHFQNGNGRPERANGPKQSSERANGPNQTPTAA
ncbi:hypothetical protein ACP70R_005414 [Stipagrostis hirtigluma subsp. patula]